MESWSLKRLTTWRLFMKRLKEAKSSDSMLVFFSLSVVAIDSLGL